MRGEYDLLLLCETLGVSRSGYYAWAKRRSARAQANERLLGQIQTIHAQSRATYGSPRVTQSLRRAGEKVGHNRVARLMQQAGLVGRQKRRYRVRTTDSNHDQPIAPNRLGRATPARAPGRPWTGLHTRRKARGKSWNATSRRR